MAQHVVWLLNRITTKAGEGMTPFEAAFGKKPDLRGVREWGEQVYVRIEGGTKLGGGVREGRWIGIDDESKGACIYWPDSKTVTVERNISYNNTSTNHFEEEMETVTINETAVNPPVKSIPSTNIETLATDIEDSDEESTKHV